MAEERKFNTDLSPEEQKQVGKVKAGYAIAQFGGGIEKSFYSTYSPYMYTNTHIPRTDAEGSFTGSFETGTLNNGLVTFAFTADTYARLNIGYVSDVNSFFVCKVDDYNDLLPYGYTECFF